MPLVTQHGKTRDPRTGHSITTSHYVNTGTPPVTLYMAPRRARMPRTAQTPHATTVEPFAPPSRPSVPCDACGAQLSPGTWPWCPH